MKNKSLVFASIILVCAFSPIAVKGQSMPHTFSANTAAKASEVNENFTYLLKRFGTRQTSVNCSAGESITTALQNYNHIVISGVCTENLSLDATTLPHRLVILEGSSSSSDGISASDTSKPVINVFNGSITLKISKLKITGGTRGIEGYLGPTIILDNILVENNTSHGIANWSGSHLFIEESTIKNNGDTGIISGWSSYVEIVRNTFTGHTNSNSIRITQAGSAWIDNNTITNAGIQIDGGSSANIRYNTIQSAENGISVENSSNAILKYNTINNNSKSGVSILNNGSVVLAEGNTISNNSRYGIEVWNGASLDMWCSAQLTSATTISSNTKAAIKAELNSTASLCNLTLTSPNVGIKGYNGASFHLNNVTITGSTDDGLKTSSSRIYVDNSTITSSTDSEIELSDSTIELYNTAITGTAGVNEIKLNYGSKLFIDNGTTITGTVRCDASVDNNSIGNWANLTLTRSGC
jgi:parallel beta-helix repeat protein